MANKKIDRPLPTQKTTSAPIKSPHKEAAKTGEANKKPLPENGRK